VPSLNRDHERPSSRDSFSSTSDRRASLRALGLATARTAARNASGLSSHSSSRDASTNRANCSGSAVTPLGAELAWVSWSPSSGLAVASRVQSSAMVSRRPGRLIAREQAYVNRSAEGGGYQSNAGPLDFEARCASFANNKESAMTVHGQEGTVGKPSGLSVGRACSPAEGADDRPSMSSATRLLMPRRRESRLAPMAPSWSVGEGRRPLFYRMA
jgi:hypothetical protein